MSKVIILDCKHCFLNLMTNAIHYSGEETTITIQLRQRSSIIEVEVIDQGIGILKQIFRIFSSAFIEWIKQDHDTRVEQDLDYLSCYQLLRRMEEV